MPQACVSLLELHLDSMINVVINKAKEVESKTQKQVQEVISKMDKKVIGIHKQRLQEKNSLKVCIGGPQATPLRKKKPQGIYRGFANQGGEECNFFKQASHVSK